MIFEAAEHSLIEFAHRCVNRCRCANLGVKFDDAPKTDKAEVPCAVLHIRNAPKNHRVVPIASAVAFGARFIVRRH